MSCSTVVSFSRRCQRPPLVGCSSNLSAASWALIPALNRPRFEIGASRPVQELPRSVSHTLDCGPGSALDLDCTATELEGRAYRCRCCTQSLFSSHSCSHQIEHVHDCEARVLSRDSQPSFVHHPARRPALACTSSCTYPSTRRPLGDLSAERRPPPLVGSHGGLNDVRGPFRRLNRRGAWLAYCDLQLPTRCTQRRGPVYS